MSAQSSPTRRCGSAVLTGFRFCAPWVRGRVSSKMFRPIASLSTVCPLGQPNKAIGLESQIEPWLAACRRKKPDRKNTRRHDFRCSPGKRKLAPTPQDGLDVGKAGCLASSWEYFFLDIPFYRTFCIALLSKKLLWKTRFPHNRKSIESFLPTLYSFPFPGQISERQIHDF